MGAKAHLLKTWPEHFAAVCDGSKTFEVRSTADRTFAVGDYLDLRCWCPIEGHFTGDRVVARVNYILEGKPFLPAGLAVMGIKTFASQVERNVVNAIDALGTYAEPAAKPAT